MNEHLRCLCGYEHTEACVSMSNVVCRCEPAHQCPPDTGEETAEERIQGLAADLLIVQVALVGLLEGLDALGDGETPDMAPLVDAGWRALEIT